MSEPLAGRAVLVTGASRGIGLAIARALVAAGARVAMLARSESALRTEAARIGALAVPVPCDLQDPIGIAAAAARVREELDGAPHILVNNAGAFALARVDETSLSAFQAMLAVNVVGPFALLREFLGGMRARGEGHIVTIGSIADRVAFPENGAYAASKFALRALHQVAREELRGTGVRATLISPGPVDTALWDPVDPDRRAGFTPRAAMLAPDAVAEAVLFAVTRPAAVNVDELRLSRA